MKEINEYANNMQSNVKHNSFAEMLMGQFFATVLNFYSMSSSEFLDEIRI